jgi:hypothetical protein
MAGIGSDRLLLIPDPSPAALTRHPLGAVATLPLLEAFLTDRPAGREVPVRARQQGWEDGLPLSPEARRIFIGTVELKRQAPRPTFLFPRE